MDETVGVENDLDGIVMDRTGVVDNMMHEKVLSGQEVDVEMLIE